MEIKMNSTIKRPEDLFKKIDSVHARATAVFNSLDPRANELLSNKKEKELSQPKNGNTIAPSNSVSSKIKLK
jgi:hypothetical protein